MARALEGTPYRKQGRSPITGLDCGGLIVYVAHQLGLTTHDCTDYGDRPNYNQFLRELKKGGFVALPTTGYEMGDVLMFKEPRWPIHGGIYLGPSPKTGQPEMAHAWLIARKVCVVPFGRTQMDKLSITFRFPEV